MSVGERFDLVDQPWVLARSLDGAVRELSLLDVLRQAPELAGLVGEVPTQVFALTRLLLAILHRAVDGPASLAEWEKLWRAEALPVSRVESYLAGYRDRFDLLHPETPFLQVAGLRTAKGEVSGLNKLVADVPNGRPFFATRLGPIAPLEFAEAARWLVHCQAFDPSGIKSGAEGDDRVKGGKGYPIGTGWSGYLGGVLPEGRNLRDTLLLNLIPPSYADDQWDEDAPVWERPPVGPSGQRSGPEAPTGPTDLYTWQSRRIRLHHDGERVTGVLICNGEKITPQNRQALEPHTAWRRSPAQEKKLGRAPIYMPREHDPQRAVWRGLQALLPAAQAVGDGASLPPLVLSWVGRVSDRVIGRSYRVRMRTIGMTYGSQSATTEDIVDDALDLGAHLLDSNAVDLVETDTSCVRDSEAAAKALGKLAQNVALASGAGRDEQAGPRARATEAAYAELDGLFRAWLRQFGLDTDPTDAKVDWHRTAWQAVDDLATDILARASMTAWVGRTSNNRLVTSTHARQWFYRDLRAALPMAHPAAPDEGAA
jgi:CRISPR system Cascade subunit CasA